MRDEKIGPRISIFFFFFQLVSISWLVGRPFVASCTISTWPEQLISELLSLVRLRAGLRTCSRVPIDSASPLKSVNTIFECVATSITPFWNSFCATVGIRCTKWLNIKFCIVTFYIRLLMGSFTHLYGTKSGCKICIPAENFIFPWAKQFLPKSLVIIA